MPSSIRRAQSDLSDVPDARDRPLAAERSLLAHRHSQGWQWSLVVDSGSVPCSVADNRRRPAAGRRSAPVGSDAGDARGGLCGVAAGDATVKACSYSNLNGLVTAELSRPWHYNAAAGVVAFSIAATAVSTGGLFPLIVDTLIIGS